MTSYKFNSVVLDANIIASSTSLSSPQINYILKVSHYLGIKIYIPKVVYDECLAFRKREIINEVANINSAISRYNKKVPNSKRCYLSPDFLSKKTDIALEVYKKILNRFLKENRISIIKYPKTPHEEIVERIYSREIPFIHSESEKGYKDFLIIESIKQEIGPKTDGDVLFITENIQDFCGKNPKPCNEESIFNGNKAEAGEKIYDLAKSFNFKNIFVARNINVAINRTLSSPEDIDFKRLFLDKSENIGRNMLQSAIISRDIFGDPLFSIGDHNNGKIKNLCVTFESISTSKDDEYLEINGIINIVFDCDFHIDASEFCLLDNSFVFKDEISKLLNLGDYFDEPDFWKFDAHDMHYSKKFRFAYVNWGTPVNDIVDVDVSDIFIY